MFNKHVSRGSKKSISKLRGRTWQQLRECALSGQHPPISKYDGDAQYCRRRTVDPIIICQTLPLTQSGTPLRTLLLSFVAFRPLRHSSKLAIILRHLSSRLHSCKRFILVTCVIVQVYCYQNRTRSKANL